MCARFDQTDSWAFLAPYIPLERVPEIAFEPKENLAPTDPILTIMPLKGELVIQAMRWGIVPNWWNKPFKDVPVVFNARAETVSEKPMFRTGFQKRRALIPVSSYYEWKKEGAKKQKYKISASGNTPLLAAAVYDLWDYEGDILISCAMITCEANSQLNDIHARMPVFLERENALEWVLGEHKKVPLEPSSGTFKIEAV